MSSEPCALCQNWLTVIANKSLIPGQGQRQHTAAWRPARANPVARQQFTGKGGELLPGSSMAAQTPASSSRQDWVCNLPGLELLIRFRPGINVLLCWSNLNTPVSCHCLLLFQKHSLLERKILYHSFIGLKKQILIFTYFSILIPWRDKGTGISVVCQLLHVFSFQKENTTKQQEDVFSLITHFRFFFFFFLGGGRSGWLSVVLCVWWWLFEVSFCDGALFVSWMSNLPSSCLWLPTEKGFLVLCLPGNPSDCCCPRPLVHINIQLSHRM